MIRLHADESVDRRVLAGLRRRGVDVSSASDAGLLGVADDRQLEFSTAQARTLRTGDRDHLAIADAWLASGKRHAGVVYYHPGWTTLGHVVREVRGIANGLAPDAVQSRILFVSRDRRR